VIDVDPQHGGDAWLSANKSRLPPTLTHKTPSGGAHFLFRDPPEAEIRNSQGRIAAGVDVRGTGGYVIVPPSTGYSVTHNGALAEMPQWLIGMPQAWSATAAAATTPTSACRRGHALWKR
jgi:hypothetical protein